MVAFLITEIVDITLLLWDGDYNLNNVKILIDPDINGMFIDEKFLKERLNTISAAYCIENTPFEIPIQFSIPNKVLLHSFYCDIIPEKDFPVEFRNQGIKIILGSPWVKVTQYPIKS